MLIRDEQRDSLAAIIVAGGYSFRMKRFKPLLRLGTSTVLARSVQSFRDAGVRDIRVVVGYRANDLLPVLDSLGVRVIFNDNFAEGMFTSVAAGVKSLTPEIKGFFLLPVDNPVIQPDTLERLRHAFFTQECDIAYPVFQAKRGHPPLIGAGFVDKVLTWDRPGGMRALLEIYAQQALEVEVSDPGILLDMDTPEDYRQMLTYCGYSQIPSEEECYSLLKNTKTMEKVVSHCRQVARLSCLIGENLNKAGCNLNPDLLKAAGLLHDVARGEPNHAAAGAKLLAQYPAVAEIVAEHMDICLTENILPTEKEIVYLADKIVKGDRLITLRERFAGSLERHRQDPAIIANIKRRLSNAETIQQSVEAILKIPLQNLWNSDLEGEANG